MLIEILSLAAELEWIALGVLVFFNLRSLNRRVDALNSRADRLLGEAEDAIR